MVYRRRTYGRRTTGMYKRKSYGVKRKSYGKRTYRSKFRRQKPMYERNTTFANPPERLRTILTTAAVVNVAPGASTYTNAILCYSGSDPFYAMGTAQGRGWDALVAQYAKYVVDKGYINLTFTNETANSVAVILYHKNGADPASYQEARQLPGAREKIVGAAGSSRTYVTFKYPFNSKYNSYGSNDDKDEWQDTSTTGADATSRGTTTSNIGIYMISLKSSAAANITGVLNMRLIQSTRFAMPKMIAADTTQT